jgi:formylglycine-generating enzyme required for sulfatase activity
VRSDSRFVILVGCLFLLVAPACGSGGGNAQDGGPGSDLVRQDATVPDAPRVPPEDTAEPDLAPTGCQGDADCDDDNFCTQDSCDTDTGLCQYAPVEDGLPCPAGICKAGMCGACPDVFCGGKCCAPGEVCSTSQECCTPSCDDVDCGDDGCGGSCGGCGTFFACEEGVCREDCDAACGERECGECPPEKPICNKDGKCEACVPDCGKKTCGDDGCGGSCGECAEGYGCIQYYDKSATCVQPCGEDSCDPDREECIETTTGQKVCAARMVHIPAGSFWMGCNNCEGSTVNDASCKDNEHPYHEIQLDSYDIDLTEVTAAQFMACVGSGVCEYNESNCYCACYKQKWGDWPANCLPWTQAKAYCEWVGKTLPTEAQWEMAARGSCELNGGVANCKNDSRLYPWGNSAPSCSEATMWGCPDSDTDQITWPVCHTSPAGDSPYGLCDMAGNVSEFVADYYGSNYYCKGPLADTTEMGIPAWLYCDECSDPFGAPEPWANPMGPATGQYEMATYRMHKGGHWDSKAKDVRVSTRTLILPSETDTEYGFRCARASAE